MPCEEAERSLNGNKDSTYSCATCGLAFCPNSCLKVGASDMSDNFSVLVRPWDSPWARLPLKLSTDLILLFDL